MNGLLERSLLVAAAARQRSRAAGDPFEVYRPRLLFGLSLGAGLALIVVILIVRKLAKDAQERQDAIEATYIAGTLEVLDEDSGDWHTLGSTEYGEPVTELTVSASSLGETGAADATLTDEVLRARLARDAPGS